MMWYFLGYWALSFVVLLMAMSKAVDAKEEKDPIRAKRINRLSSILGAIAILLFIGLVVWAIRLLSNNA